MVNLGCGAERMLLIVVKRDGAQTNCSGDCSGDCSGEDETSAQCKLCGGKERNLLSKVGDKPD